MKPRVFLLSDALTYGLAAVIATVVSLIATLRPENWDLPWSAWAITWTMVAVFWFGYIQVLRWRWGLKKRVAFTTRHGLVFIHDGGVMPSQLAVEVESDRVARAWMKAEQVWDTGLKSSVMAEEVFSKGVMVFVKPAPFELQHGKTKKYMGFAKPFSRSIAVGMDGRPLDNTALAHELGHIILFDVSGNGSEAALIRAHEKWGVPY